MSNSVRKRVLIGLMGIFLLLLSLSQHVTAVANNSNGDLSIHVGIKKSSGMSNASIKGTFIMCQYGTNPKPWIGHAPLIEPNPWTGRLGLTLDGNGNGTYQQLDDSSGYSNSGSFTYSVAGDGKLSVTGEGIEDVGIVSADGNIFVLVDTNASDNDLSIHVGIKKSSGMSNASINGTFIMGEYGTDPNPWAGRIEHTFDGNGNGTYQQLENSSGSTNSGSFTYSVASDGKLSVTGEGIEDVGIVSADGNMFVLVDTNDSISVVPPIQLLLLGD